MLHYNSGSNFEDIADLVAKTNDDIQNQNERYELSFALDDEDLKSIALAGLTAEQLKSVEHRDTLNNVLDFEEINKQMSDDYKAELQASEELEKTNAAASHVTEQAKLAGRVSPTLINEINKAAKLKKDALLQRAQEAKLELEQITIRNVGFVAVGTAWIIPKLVEPGINKVLSKSDEFMTEATPVEPVTALEPTESLQASDTIAPISLVKSETARNQESNAVLGKTFWAVCKYAMDHSDEGIRVEEMRKNIPELALLSQIDYDYFRLNFASLRDYIQDNLTRMGVKTSWSIFGKTRGTRYSIITDTGSDNQPTLTELKSTYDASLAVRATIVEKNATTQIPGVSPVELLDGAEVTLHKKSDVIDFLNMNAEELRSVPLVKTVMLKLEELQIEHGNEMLRLNFLSKQLSDLLGINAKATHRLLTDLAKAGVLHVRGKRNGVFLYSTIAGEDTDVETAVTTQTQPQVQAEPIGNTANPQVESADKPEVEDEPFYKLFHLKKGLDRANNGTNIAEIVVDTAKLIKRFGIKDNALINDVFAWIDYLQLNPLSPASSHLTDRVVNVNGTIFALYRFAPSKCQNVPSTLHSKSYRIVYTFEPNQRQLYIVDIGGHNKFDQKWGH
ncbi:hypothetical protein H7171_01920 [Candidatus Saccharibacteria bacterium]|nr:hypothetical protein [Candidatus Saccharibacteria bacterium]